MKTNERIRNFLQLIVNEIEENGPIQYADIDTEETILNTAKKLLKIVSRFDTLQKVYFVDWISISDYTMRIKEGFYFASGGINGLGELATHFVSLTEKPLEPHLIVDDANIFATKEEAEKRMKELAAAHKDKGEKCK